MDLQPVAKPREPFSTPPDSYGIIRKYTYGKPSFTPDEFYTVSDAANSPNMVVNPSSATRKWFSPFGSSIENIEASVTLSYAPFPNISIFRLMSWYYNASNTKSLGELNKLVSEVILAKDFQPDHFIGFNASKESKRLGAERSIPPATSTTSPPFSVKDGWIETSVFISCPCDGVRHSSEAIAPKYEVKGLFYRPPLEVVKAALSEPGAEKFHTTPFKSYWKPAPHEPEEPHHVAYIPKLGSDIQEFYLKTFGELATTETLTHLRRELMQAVWLLLLDDEFVHAYVHGFEMELFDELLSLLFPRFLAHSADYPEKVLMSGIKYLSDCPCPRCTTLKNNIPRLGTMRDLCNRERLMRIDNEHRQFDIEMVRKWLYVDGKNITSVHIDRVLGPKSLVPTRNAFSFRLFEHGFNFYRLFAPDLLHEFELGVWKAIFIHLLRMAYAQGDDTIMKLNARFRQVPTFGRDTIRRFTANVSGLKKLAARDFEDILQVRLEVRACIPSTTLNDLENSTTRLGEVLRKFQSDVCPAYNTKDLPSEETARVRRQAAHAKKTATRPTKKATPPESNTSKPKKRSKRRNLNIATYKVHSLGGYVRSIREHGTTDNTSSQTGELEHRRVKRFYPRVHKGKHVAGIATQVHHERLLHNLNEQNKKAQTQASEALPPTPPEQHHHISEETRHKVPLAGWLGENEEDPALKNFLPRLKDHLLARLLGNPEASEELKCTPADRATVIINKNRIFRHRVMRVNYTTYDLRRDQDSINPRTHPDIMVLSGETEENSEEPHPYWYARVIGIFHAQVLHVGPQSKSSGLQHMEFLFVRWFGRDLNYSAGWKSKKLHRIGFMGENNSPFGFLDPGQVVRGVHLIPAFAHGHTRNILGPSKIGRPFSLTDDDWQYFYVNKFVDRDMAMRYRGGGVGHKSTREATDFFKTDRDPLDIKRRGRKQPSGDEIDEGDSDEGDGDEGEGDTDEDDEDEMEYGSEEEENDDDDDDDEAEEEGDDNEERDGPIEDMELLGYAEF
ncbi:hypothetical protein GALMADRAFT_62788 [Galerina marginata CBS 339.88]|uniref:Uncharacterized protein n=1 Tax=Galerina marginata (strain CBS 339.88) TaxID=685588 RepID=A0A067TAD3_GALM3|nr:hypothetical protein GALMADRAFT_62788 [Galerina marginata CBS 339.88]